MNAMMDNIKNKKRSLILTGVGLKRPFQSGVWQAFGLMMPNENQKQTSY